MGKKRIYFEIAPPHPHFNILGSFLRETLSTDHEERSPEVAECLLAYCGLHVRANRGSQTLAPQAPCNLYESPLETDLFFFKFWPEDFDKKFDLTCSN